MPRAASLQWLMLITVVLGLGIGSASAQSDTVLTYHFDNARSGQITTETTLVSPKVNPTRFGKLFFYPVDGQVAAQPLYVPNLTLPGLGKHNVVFAVTQHDSVYALDADNPATGTLWHANFLNPAAGVTSVPISEQGCADTGFTEMGILGTPVIDSTTGTLYVAVKTREQSGSTVNYVHRLHALDITTGAEKFGGPVVVTPNGSSEFNTLGQCQRPALLLSNGTLFIAYGSNGCDLKAHGWIMAYNPTTLQQLATFNASQNYTWGSSIWMSGGGIAADSEGNIYVVTANGPFDANVNNGPDYGDTVLKLSYSQGAFTVVDYFTPFDQQNMDNMDLDLGSGGVTLLPDQTGVHEHELVTSGKTGTIYLIDRDNMGHFNSGGQNDDQIVQPIPAALGLFDSVPVYWNNMVYFAAHGDTVKAFSLSNGALSWNPVAQSVKYAQVGNPIVSSSGTQGGILWNIHNPVSPVLSALDAITLAEIYNSSQKGNRDVLGAVNHFATPIVANNKVFVGTQNALTVYGLFPYLSTPSGDKQTGAAGTTLASPLTVQAVDSQGKGVAGVTVNFTASASGGTFSNPTAVTDVNGNAKTNYTLPTKAQSIGFTATATGYTQILMSATAVPGPATMIVKFSGMGQTGDVGTTLPAPLVMKLRDAYNNPIVGQPITFSDTAPHGSFSPNPAITNSTGLATVLYTLPTSTQPISTKTTFATGTYGILSATMTDKAVVGPATSLTIAGGNNQVGKIKTKLPSILLVLVTDQYGNPEPGLTVSYSDGGAGGTLSAPSAVTNGVGKAYVTYILPGTPGVVTVTASVSGLTPVQFTETAQ